MWLLLLDKALLSSWGTSCMDQTICILIEWLGKSIFDINMKNMSRTIIIETANLSGNRQSEHLYYHILLKNLEYTMYFVTVVRVDYLGVFPIFKETNFYTGILVLYFVWPYFQVFNSCSKKFILQKTLISHSLWKKQYTYRAFYNSFKIFIFTSFGKVQD